MISNASIGIMQQQQQQQGSFTQLSQEKINILYRYLTFNNHYYYHINKNRHEI